MLRSGRVDKVSYRVVLTRILEITREGTTTVADMASMALAEGVRERWRKAAEGCPARYSRLAFLLGDVEPDGLACFTFQREQWHQNHSSNPLEWFIKEIKRRTDVVGMFPNDVAVMPIVGLVPAEQHDERQVGLRHLSADSLAKLGEEVLSDIPPALFAAG
jgi:putative transposase